MFELFGSLQKGINLFWKNRQINSFESKSWQKLIGFSFILTVVILSNQTGDFFSDIYLTLAVF